MKSNRYKPMSNSENPCLYKKDEKRERWKTLFKTSKTQLSLTKRVSTKLPHTPQKEEHKGENWDRRSQREAILTGKEFWTLMLLVVSSSHEVLREDPSLSMWVLSKRWQCCKGHELVVVLSIISFSWSFTHMVAKTIVG